MTTGRILRGTRAASISRLKSSTFLELQMLINNRNFLERQLAAMEQRKIEIGEQLDYIGKEMKRIESFVNRNSEDIKRNGTPKRKYGVELKTIEYC